MTTPADKIAVMSGSLRCFVLGWLGLVPVVGIPFAVWALSEFRKVWVRAQGETNPASLYLIWGLVLALLGLMVTSLLALWIVLALCGLAGGE